VSRLTHLMLINARSCAFHEKAKRGVFVPEILGLFWGMFAILGGVVLIGGIALFAWSRFRASGQEKGI
jgi:hypothetical protein